MNSGKLCRRGAADYFFCPFCTIPWVGVYEFSTDGGDLVVLFADVTAGQSIMPSVDH